MSDDQAIQIQQLRHALSQRDERIEAQAAELAKQKEMVKGCIQDICDFEREMEEKFGMEFTDDYGGRWHGDVITEYINKQAAEVARVTALAYNDKGNSYKQLFEDMRDAYNEVAQWHNALQEELTMLKNSTRTQTSGW